MFKDETFCPRLIKAIVKSVRNANWVKVASKNERFCGWSFTGDCGLTFDVDTQKYGFDT